MAKQNAIGNKSAELTIDPGASGDSFVQFDINATGEFRIGVDDTDDSFRISQGSALGTTDTFVMTAAGERTMPLQPAFYGYVGTDILNVTGDATAYTIIFDSERFDQGGDFNTTTGVFTAPVTGRYYLSTNMLLAQLTASHTRSNNFISTSNQPTLPVFDVNSMAAIKSASDTATSGWGGLFDMDAADVASVSVNVIGGTKVIDVISSHTVFMGYLAV